MSNSSDRILNERAAVPEPPPAPAVTPVPPPVAPPPRIPVPPTPPAIPSRTQAAGAQGATQVGSSTPPVPRPAAPPPTAKPPAANSSVSESGNQALKALGNVPSAIASRRRRQAAKEHSSAAKREPRRVPSWLVSFVFHVGLLLVLALIPVHRLVQAPLSFVFGNAGDDPIGEFELSGAPEDKQADAEASDLPNPMESEIKLSELLTTDIERLIDKTVVTSVVGSAMAELPQGILSGLSGRSGLNKQAMLSKYGGSAETEAAVEAGLEWLAKQQKSDGSWSLLGPYSDPGINENTIAATALALNAFLGAGYTHRDGKYVENVRLGLRYLMRLQERDGQFKHSGPTRHQMKMYAQAIASITILEAFGMTDDETLLSSAKKCVSYAEWSQSKLHGWRYEPREDADLSVTGWFVMALSTAKMAGLYIDEEKLASVHEFLDSISSDEQSRYAYNHFEGPSLSMTAEGMLCRIMLGWPDTSPALTRAIVDDLLPSRPSLNDSEYSVYYWYYATQVMHHVGGNAWDEWNLAMKRTLPAMQETEGNEKGSWDPNRDVYGASGGRLYTTCLHIYCLEVYYRHLSIYEQR